MDEACAGMDKEGHEGPAARLEGTEYLNDRGPECEARSTAYASFPWEQHSGFVPALHQGAQEDQPPA